MTDLNFQNFSTVQSDKQPMPVTIASAATITPITLITYVSGTVQVETITPPVSGQHMLVLIFTDANPGTMLTTGNINNAVIPTQNLPTLMFYDPATGKYTGGTMNLT
jgi:hypothetical protein